MEQRLTMLQDRVGKTPDGHVLALYVCACGNEHVAARSRVKNGYTRSCGCLSRYTSSEVARTHGMRNSPEYSSWQAMKGRCHSPGSKDYPRYGGVGIFVCDEWRESFDAFFAHIGPRPIGTSLDRIDNTKGYVPGNVRWATDSEQQRNCRGAKRWFIKGGEFPTAEDAATHFGVSKHTVWRWVNGAYDKRRDTFTEPRRDCYAVERY